MKNRGVTSNFPIHPGDDMSARRFSAIIDVWMPVT